VNELGTLFFHLLTFYSCCPELIPVCVTSIVRIIQFPFEAEQKKTTNKTPPKEHKRYAVALVEA